VQGRTYLDFEYDSEAFKNELIQALQRWQPDLIHLDSLDLLTWRQYLPKGPTTCTHHSIESELLRLQADRVGSRAVAAYVHHQADLLEKVERSVCPDLDLNIMMSRLDAARLE